MATSKKANRVEIAVAGPQREMEGGEAMGNAAEADRLSGGHFLATVDEAGGQKRVASPETASVLDRDRLIARHHPGEGNGPGGRRSHH